MKPRFGTFLAAPKKGMHMKTKTPPSPSVRRTLFPLPVSVLGTASAALLVAACAPQGLGGEEPPADEQGFLSASVTAKGSSLRSMGFTAASLDVAGQPMLLSGRIPAAIRTASDVRAFLTSNLATSFRLAGGTDFVAASETPVTDELGHRYFKLRQTYAGVPIAAAEVVVQVAEDGAVLAVAGRPLPGLRVGTTPQLTGERALGIALDRLVTAGSSRKIHEAPVLQIHTDEDGGKAALTYRAVVEYIGQNGFAFEEIFVDAGSGDVIAQHSRIHRGLEREIYDGKKKCLQTGDEIPGTLLFKEGGTSTDTSGKAAYDNTGATYWFYKNFFGRDSYDGAGAKLVSSVHLQFSNGFSCDGNNAAWLGSPYNQMVYGDGDGAIFKPLAGALDVTAHELTHAVTDVSSDLTYANESGALNEAMSDILGSVAEAWVASGGTSAGNPASVAVTAKTWQIGEDITVAGSLPGNALRFMDNPTADAYSKDYYPERLTGSSDNGGVHGNSGIANLAFYLLSQGGTHPRGKTTTRVDGIGIGKAGKIFFTANTTLFTASTNFASARNLTAQAAKTLYGDCSPEWTSTQKAWDAVGVGGTWTPCGTTGDTTAPTAAVTAPASGATVSGTVTITATATDAVGVTGVDFYRGTVLLGSDATSPYSLSWDTTGTPDGAASITVKAKDAAGNVGTSAAVSVTVKNGTTTGTTRNEAEPNGSFNQGNVITVSGTTVTGYISSTSDKDYFKVSLPAGKTLTAVLTPPSTSDFDLYLYNSAQVQVAKSEKDVGIVETAQATNSGTAAATYYINVRYYSGASTTKPYTLKLTW